MTQMLVRHHAGERAAQIVFLDDDDLVDVLAHEVERDGVRIEIAGETVGERRRDVDRDEAPRRERRGEQARRGRLRRR